jgi:hypothetical protein
MVVDAPPRRATEAAAQCCIVSGEHRALREYSARHSGAGAQRAR